MKQKISAREKFYQLRKQAEALMINTDFSDETPVMDDSLRLIQELQTFQIELELQNEELHRSQQELMKSIATVAGGVAHDFNNALSIILGNSELIMKDIPESNPFYPRLEIIKATTLRAAGIVRMLLNFSRKTEEDQKPLGIVSAMNKNVKLLRSLIPATIDIRMFLPDTEIMILAAPMQFNQILMNLCTNAAQAMDQTGGFIEIKLETKFLEQGAVILYPGLKAGYYAKITVSDNGPGIDPEIRDQIFDPYFTTREFGKGSGMGLSVVHGIVKNHNGAIAVAGEPLKGACFTILFPMIDQPSEINNKLPSELVRVTESILFVDDEVSIAQVAEESLKLLGYRVESLSDPKDALALFKLNPGYFDVVITDMIMPRMTGIELAEALRSIRPDIPIIISTGYSRLIDENKARQIGITGYIEKPISISNIAKIIRQVIDQRQVSIEAF